MGLMQVMPETARDLAGPKRVDRRQFPPDKLLDPATNIEYGTAYMRYLVDRYHEIEMALAAYNAGLSRVDEWAKKGNDIRATIEFPETRAVRAQGDAWERTISRRSTRTPSPSRRGCRR